MLFLQTHSPHNRVCFGRQGTAEHLCSSNVSAAQRPQKRTHREERSHSRDRGVNRPHVTTTRPDATSMRCPVWGTVPHRIFSNCPPGAFSVFIPVRPVVPGPEIRPSPVRCRMDHARQVGLHRLPRASARGRGLFSCTAPGEPHPGR